MIRKEMKEIPATTREVIVDRWCDLCGKRQRHPDGDWGSGAFDVLEVTVEYNSGTSYPDSNSGSRLSVDMCPDCFKLKLIPWLRSQGAEMTREEWQS